MLSETTFPFLARLGPAGRRELGALATTRARPNRPLLQRGDRVDGVFLVIGGSLRVYYITAGGREATLYHVEPGTTCILALTSTIDEAPYPAWADSGPGGAAFVRVPRARFRRLLAEEEAVRDFAFGALSGRVFELMAALEEAGSAQIEQRVARYLVRHVGAGDAVQASQIGIASELGTAREVVFRALRSLAARGWVRTGRLRITVVDRRALQQFAG